MAANEATCLRLAAVCALEAAETELLDVAGLPVLAVRRYDRRESPAGVLPGRMHQEDGCQATAVPPGMKYEEQGGPSLHDLADLLRNYGDPADVNIGRFCSSRDVSAHEAMSRRVFTITRQACQN
jgi:serine/threonine-protein kinase HipA